MSDGKEFPSDKADKFVVRFPDGMREKIRAAAEANNRSMNAEIVARLQESFDWLTIDGSPVHRDSIELVETDRLEKIVTKVAERTANEYRLALAEALRGLSTADSMKDAAQRALDELSIAKSLVPKK